MKILFYVEIGAFRGLTSFSSPGRGMRLPGDVSPANQNTRRFQKPTRSRAPQDFPVVCPLQAPTKKLTTDNYIEDVPH